MENNNDVNQINNHYLLKNPYIKKEIKQISKRIKSNKIFDKLVKLKDNNSNDQIKNRNNILKENTFSINRCIFSNIEINKHINDSKNDNIIGDNNSNLSYKMINLKSMNNSNDNKNKYNKNYSLNIYKNIISKNASYSSHKNRNESKDELLIKHRNNSLFQEIIEDKFYITTPKICSKGSFRINKNFFSPDNKKLKLLKINDEIYNETKKNQNNNTNKPNNFTFPKTKVINDILIDNNNIRTNYQENIKKSKLYLDIYNYHIMKSIIHKKGKFFENKKINYLPFQLYKFRNNRNILYNKDEININNYFNNINNNNFSLRELYRTMNDENHFFYSPFNKNQNKKNNKKKKEKKSCKLRIIKRDIEKNIENNKKKIFNLTNLQYDFDKSNQEKKFEFVKTIRRRRRKNINLNKKINLGNKNDDYLQFF